MVQLLQPRDNTRKIDLAFTNRNFLAEISRVGRPQPILGMNSFYVWAEYPDCIHRICFAVQNQIREIEIDALVVCPNIMDGAYKGDWSFLSGLVTEILAVAGNGSKRARF
jgi:hypothetical protein